MSIIKVVAFDPSMTNWGVCKASVCLETSRIVIDGLVLIQTKSESKKGVIKQSDDIRRAKEVRHGMMAACIGRAIAISEIPFMNPGSYASANFNAGLVTGVLASCPVPLIQVFPRDVKLVTGDKNADKDDMMAWAFEKYPDAPWITRKLKGKAVRTKANEHLADAVAALHAGIETQQFAQAAAMYRSMIKAA